ncbi:hypothetical protein GCM10018772_42080 [Streptomyces fumanus]|uniref:Uncharacterized protein n=1 Tax=Streptomyces fumanus TaxID=67302 RepID=A0A919E4B5_9ACTN|nr:hypothetical protein GCM10018772_42080 [Streptomyces fumanus]
MTRFGEIVTRAATATRGSVVSPRALTDTRAAGPAVADVVCPTPEGQVERDEPVVALNVLTGNLGFGNQ